MTSEDLDNASTINNQALKKNEFSTELPKKTPPNCFYDGNLKYPEHLSDDDVLGPLPPKWEKAYTESGEVYFIDHNSSTSHWLDPRLSRIQKKSLEDCSEDELPYGWERINDPLYGTYYIDHVNRQTQYENPVLLAKYSKKLPLNSETAINNADFPEKININNAFNHDDGYNYYSNCFKSKKGMPENNFFTLNPDELIGERIHSTLEKSFKGLGFTIIGGDDSKEEFLQIKSIVLNGPAWYEGKLKTGDVLVFVNNKCVLGLTHHDMVSVFQSIAPGDTVEIEVCRGYPLPFDPNDPNTEILTTVAVGNNDSTINTFVEQDSFTKRQMIDSNDTPNNSVPNYYFSKKISTPNSMCSDLIINKDDKSTRLKMSIVKGVMGFGFTIADSAYGQKVKKILDKQRCENLMEGDILIEINNTCVREMCHSDVVQVLKNCPCNKSATIIVERINFSDNKLRKKDDLTLNVNRKTPDNSLLTETSLNNPKSSECFNNLKTNAETFSLENNLQSCYSRSQSPGNELDLNDSSWYNKHSTEVYSNDELLPVRSGGNYYNDHCANRSVTNEDYFSSVVNNSRKENATFEHSLPINNDVRYYKRDLIPSVNSYGSDNQYIEQIVSIERQESGFGFRIVGGIEEGSQVSIGHIVEKGAAEIDGRLRSGDEILSVNDQSVINSSHHHVVQLMGKAATMGKVKLGIRRKIPYKNSNMFMPQGIQYPCNVTVTRRENEGFGFVIISSINRAGSAIGRIIEGSPAERSGLLHVGDNIIAINGINIMNLHHGDIVNLIKDSGYSVSLTIDNNMTGDIVSTPPSYQNEEIYEGQYHAIEINRGLRGFGFSIRGGREFKNMELFVLQIAENGPAALDGRLKVGDKLIEINGINTKNMTHAEAIEIIRNGGSVVRLLIQRGSKVPPLPSEEHLIHSPSQRCNSVFCLPNDS